MKAAKTKKPVKKKVDELPQAFEPVETEAFMTRDEQLALEEATGNVEKARLALALAEQVTVNKHLELQLSQRAVKDAQATQLQKEAEHKQRTKLAGEHVLRLREKYGITGDFRYDPLSGRIVTESE